MNIIKIINEVKKTLKDQDSYIERFKGPLIYAEIAEIEDIYKIKEKLNEEGYKCWIDVVDENDEIIDNKDGINNSKIFTSLYKYGCILTIDALVINKHNHKYLDIVRSLIISNVAAATKLIHDAEDLVADYYTTENEEGLFHHAPFPDFKKDLKHIDTDIDNLMDLSGLKFTDDDDECME